MVVAIVVVVTIVVFVLVDWALLNRAIEERVRKEREQALDKGLKLDVSEEASTLVRVEVENPKARILAVDDESIILDGFRKVLVLAGYSIDTVEKASEALGLLRKHDYDFLFTDLKMPEMDGVELTRAARHLRPDVDVVVITGYASIETAVETVKVGAMDYVEKPFTEDELLSFLKTALIKREAKLEKHMRHKVHLVKPGTTESRSKFELNVPAGIFVSPQHAWAKIESNGVVRVGPDDLIRKAAEKVEQVGLPYKGEDIKKGHTLFSLKIGDFILKIPSPISGKISDVNTEHADHPEWLAIKPFRLSWMCGIEPSDLSSELQDLKLGRDSVEWYQQEIARYHALADKFLEVTGGDESVASPVTANSEYHRMLREFCEPFLSAVSTG